MKYLLLLFLLSCASKPILYPNQKFKTVGKKNAKQDINACMADADEFLESSKGKQILKGAGRGSIFGAVLGGVTGLITGDVQGSALRGAAFGGAAGATGEAISPDRLKRSYTNQCLAKEGYQVIGWD